MIAVRRLIPNYPGRDISRVPCRRRVGNEATVSTWFPVGDGVVTTADFCTGVFAAGVYIPKGLCPPAQGWLAEPTLGLSVEII
jgi:hypothetical protein